MSFNQNFYNNFHGNTFHNAPQFLPPPPPPPAYFIPPQLPWDSATRDANFLKQFESKLPTSQHAQPKTSSISVLVDEINRLFFMLKKLNNKIVMLFEHLEELSKQERDSNLRHLEDCRAAAYKMVSTIKSLKIEVVRKLVAKRLKKRARLKRLRSERKREKEEWIKQMQEKSRQIDEKLQKIRDDTLKAKQEEEANIQADIVLKETLRKKHDAKKFIVKLDALMKLRRAKQNTAKGRGESVSEVEAETFNNNIEKLKTLWKQRLVIYEKEESKLRAKLDEDTVEPAGNQTDMEAMDNLEKWKESLFGGMMPQVDFAGDVARFISVRSQWDEFVISGGGGSSLPAGWVPPSIRVSSD